MPCGRVIGCSPWLPGSAWLLAAHPDWGCGAAVPVAGTAGLSAAGAQRPGAAQGHLCVSEGNVVAVGWATAHPGAMRVLRESNADEMVACFLHGELNSERFGQGIRDALRVCGRPETLLTRPDVADQHANQARRALLAATRGYGEDRGIFEHFPATVRWEWAWLTAAELAQVRYIEYSYWNEISGGSRLAADAAKNIRAGVRPYGVSNQRFIRAARGLLRGDRFPPLILAGPGFDELVCLEGNLRLTAHALAGFPGGAECLVGTAPTLRRWAQ